MGIFAEYSSDSGAMKAIRREAKQRYLPKTDLSERWHGHLMWFKPGKWLWGGGLWNDIRFWRHVGESGC